MQKEDKRMVCSIEKQKVGTEIKTSDSWQIFKIMSEICRWF